MNDSENLFEQTLERATMKPPVSQKATSKIVDEISSHKGIVRLFHLIRESPHLAKLLFLHPLDLFGKEGRYQAPYLYYGQISTDTQKDSNISRALKLLRIDREATSSLALATRLKKMGIDEERQETIGSDIIDAVIYILVMIFKVSPTLRELVESENFSYPLMKSTIKNYANLIDEEELEQAMESIFSEESADPEFIDLIERLILSVVPLITGKSLEFIEMGRTSQSQITLAYHQIAISFVDDLLTKTSISFEEYGEIVKQLYMFGLIKNRNTIFWCEKCMEDRISYNERHGHISPSKMSERTCPDCGESESFSAVFEVDLALLDAIFSRDHLLGVFVGWILKKEGIDAEINTHVDDREVDFLTDTALIECKTFRVGGREETPRQNLEQVLVQMQKQVAALEEDERTMENVMLVCNQPDIRKELSNIAGKAKSFYDEYCPEVFSYEEIDEMVESLR
ncbi:MAG: hypothetical protein GF309_13465 [Candidatus Lokiarchaeota archaeon]|nr:hypothetical protein [Candidatus Lokiarchaeota archaeon]